LTETYFEEAIQRAEQLDAMRKNGTLAGPLHGLPVSVKDTFKIKGSDATMGCASLIGKPAESNSSLIDLLLEQGAVVHCKTNVAQVLRVGFSFVLVQCGCRAHSFQTRPGAQL
jgi:Asp-tRNA(Asn)/Glu-tRNA(Gln) amidotransferase A subunit family amidase